MRCGEYTVPQVLVGLHRVGIVGLRQACARVAKTGLDDREAIVDALLEELSGDNYIIENQIDAYRIALWREYLRSQGGDFSPYISSLGVTVVGEPGDDRDCLIELCRSVLADFELRPEIELVQPDDGEPELRLVIGDSVVASGLPSRRTLKTVVRRRLSDW